MSGEDPRDDATRPPEPQPQPAQGHSLCIGICLLDDNGYCIGCGRTTEQIANLPPEPAGRP